MVGNTYGGKREDRHKVSNQHASEVKLAGSHGGYCAH